MSSRVGTVVDIAAPPEQVFAFFDDLANAAVLVPALADITGVEDLETGGRRVEYRISGRDGSLRDASSEHLVYEPPFRTVTRSVQSGVFTTVTRDFIPVEGGTQLRATLEWDVPLRALTRVVAAPLRGPTKRALRDGLLAARDAIERP